MVGDPRSDWPDWAEPLRPDDVSRARMRRGIRERSTRLLARRRGDVWPVLEGWAGVLMPVAAAVLIACSWAALQGGPRPGPGGTAAGTGLPAGGVASAAASDAPVLLVSELGARGEQVVETSFLSGL